jgi:hypothetical protein
MFDLASLDTRTRSEAGVPLTLVHPKTRGPVTRADGSVVTVTLLGRCSDTHRDKSRELAERTAEMASRGIRQSRDEREADDAELLVACTKGWTIDKMDGQDFPYSPENARRLWTDTRFLWLRDQAVNHVLTDGNFLPV